MCELHVVAVNNAFPVVHSDLFSSKGIAPPLLQLVL